MRPRLSEFIQAVSLLRSEIKRGKPVNGVIVRRCVMTIIDFSETDSYNNMVSQEEYKLNAARYEDKE